MKTVLFIVVQTCPFTHNLAQVQGYGSQKPGATLHFLTLPWRTYGCRDYLSHFPDSVALRLATPDGAGEAGLQLHGCF